MAKMQMQIQIISHEQLALSTDEGLHSAKAQTGWLGNLQISLCHYSTALARATAQQK